MSRVIPETLCLAFCLTLYSPFAHAEDEVLPALGELIQIAEGVSSGRLEKEELVIDRWLGKAVSPKRLRPEHGPHDRWGEGARLLTFWREGRSISFPLSPATEPPAWRLVEAVAEGQRSLVELAPLLEEDLPPGLRAMAVAEIARSKRYDEASVTSVLCTSKQRSVIELAMEIAGDEKMESALECLLGRVEDPRLAGPAAAAMGAFGPEYVARIAPRLRQRIETGDPIRLEAMVALGELGDVRSMDRLLSAALDPDPESAMTAVHALSLMGSAAHEALRVVSRSSKDDYIQNLAARLGEQR